MIRLSNISYPVKNPLLKEIRLELKNGEIVGLIGKAGSGKSTLLKLISLQVRMPKAIKTSITFKNRMGSMFTVKELSRLINIPVNQMPENLDETLANFLLLSRMPYKEFMSPFKDYDFEITNSFLERFGLSPHSRLPLRNLSSSILQRAMLAYSFIREPELMLLDNPTDNLDLEGQKKLYKELIKFTMDGDRTALIASHDINFISQLVDRIIVLDSGKIVEDVPIEKFSDKILKTYLSVDTIVARNIYNGRPLIHLFPDN